MIHNDTSVVLIDPHPDPNPYPEPNPDPDPDPDPKPKTETDTETNPVLINQSNYQSRHLSYPIPKN
jgi:hypothetical protein